MLTPFTKEGIRIVGTLEHLTGTAIINGGRRMADGSVHLEYEGTTEIDWNNQKTVRCEHTGQRIFVDENGLCHSENEIKWLREVRRKTTKR